MQNMKSLAIFGIALLIFSACSSSKKVKKPLDANIFSDSIVRHIHDLKDRREAIKLAEYLSHTSPIYRSQAAFSLASVGDSTVQQYLIDRFLIDKDALVQKNIGFGIGPVPKRAFGKRFKTTFFKKPVI